MLFPARYRQALFVGLVIGFVQGIITYFFDEFVCSMSSGGSITDLYCQQQTFDPSKGFLALMFLYLLAVGPAIFFLVRLERIRAPWANKSRVRKGATIHFRHSGHALRSSVHPRLLLLLKI